MNALPPVAPDCPVAVVGMGMVVPGADSLGGYWKLHEAGVPQFSEPQGRWPLRGYYAATDRDDRGYAARLGFVNQQPGAADDGLSADADRTTVWLRHAIKEALPGIQLRPDDHWSFVLGYTADGSNELLNCLPAASLAHSRSGASERLTKALGYASTEPERHLPHAVAREAISGLLPDSTEFLVIDAACSSGLYAVDLGIRQIAAGRADIVVGAGAFAVGWRDMVLFSKLHGLSRSGDVRPMDRDADGVLFSDGAAVVILKSLQRARADRDTIFGIIAGSGVSCDGRGKAIYAPRGEGQRAAIHRAWKAARVSAKEIDAIVAHATGTPLGDATELGVLGELFAQAGPVAVVSPKSIVGHTGWCAGIVSLIHALLILKNGRIPPQHRFSQLGESLRPLSATLNIPTGWTDLPRRAERPRALGVSAFGFGGINAHLVLMEEHPSLLPTQASSPSQCSAVILDWDAYLPGEPDRTGVMDWLAHGRGAPATRFGVELRRFEFAELRVPADTAAAMDPGQLMAVRAAGRLKARMGEIWGQNRERIGVFGGHMGPSRNGVLYALRCALGFVEEADTEPPRSPGQRNAIEGYADAVRNEIPTSSKDSYPGLMPNLVAARVANVLDAQGLNLVTDTGTDSFSSALKVAATYLDDGLIDFAVVLSIDANVTPEWREIAHRSAKFGAVELCEGVFALLLARRDAAERNHLHPIAKIEWAGSLGEPPSDETIPRRCYLVGDQALRLLKTLVTRECPTITLRGRPDRPARSGSLPPANIQSPVSRHVVRLVQTSSTGCQPGYPFLVRNSIVISNVADPFGGQSRPEDSTVFSTHPHTPGAIVLAPIDAASFDRALPVDGEHRDHIRIVVNLPSPSLVQSEHIDSLLTIAEMCFLAVKHVGAKQRPHCTFSALLLDALEDGVPRPESAIFTGFATALADEFPDMLVSVLATSAGSAEQAPALPPIEGPGKRGAPVILYEDRGRRWSLRPVLAEETEPRLTEIEDVSVVVAAGGARGITVPILREIARHKRPKIWLLGSLDLASYPNWVFSGTDDEFAARRLSFIREEVGRGGVTPIEAAQKFKRYNQARETYSSLQSLEELCGESRIHYLSCDVTDPAATERAVRRITESDPEIDLLLFAAGIEHTAPVARKSLGDFRRVLETKVKGYVNLKRAFATHRPRMWCNFGSVSGLKGVRGLIDYCAANAFLGAAATHSSSIGGRDEWTIGWPLWSQIGMGNGHLRLPWTPITPDEGVRLFLAELLRSKRDPYVAFLGPLEKALLAGSEDSRGDRRDVPAQSRPAESSGLPFLGAVVEESPDRLVFETSLAPHDEPALADHCIHGYPTMPAMLAVEIAAGAAMRLVGQRPTQFENIECLRFLRCKRPGGKLWYRTEVSRKSDQEGAERVYVRILTDVVTSTGVTLAKNIVHFSMDVTFGQAAGPSGAVEPLSEVGTPVEDPYYNNDATVRLTGAFQNTQKVRATDQHAQAAFYLPELTHPGWLGRTTPILLLDAAARIGVIAGARGDLPYPAVIARMGRVRLYTDRNDVGLQTDHPEGLSIVGRAIGAAGLDGTGACQCVASTAAGVPLVELEGIHYLRLEDPALRRAAE